MANKYATILDSVRAKRELRKSREAAEIYNRLEFLDKSKGETGANGKDGKDGAKGETGKQGPKGEAGEKGDTPKHQWSGTSIRFEQPDGTWGQWVDLRGPAGLNGRGKGGNGIISGGHALEGLPISDDTYTTPDRIALKQNGVWVQMAWADFAAFLGGSVAPTNQVTIGGQTVTINGTPMSIT